MFSRILGRRALVNTSCSVDCIPVVPGTALSDSEQGEEPVDTTGIVDMLSVVQALGG